MTIEDKIDQINLSCDHSLADDIYTLLTDANLETRLKVIYEQMITIRNDLYSMATFDSITNILKEINFVEERGNNNENECKY